MIAAPALALAVVLIEVGSGKVLRQEGDSMRRAAPGSTIKPFVLRAAGHSEPAGRMCGRRLRLAGRNMNCVHPVLAAPLSAREALAYSCNSYFAGLARAIEPVHLAEALRSFGFVLSREPETAEERQLMALGEFGVTTTPLDLARAYARLAATGGQEGLREAVEVGTAQRAAVDGLAVAGKTGTTRGLAWFAGYAPVDKPRVAVAVLTAEGTGGSAAAPEAARVLREWFARR